MGRGSGRGRGGRCPRPPCPPRWTRARQVRRRERALSPLPCISPPLDVEAKMVESAALKRRGSGKLVKRRPSVSVVLRPHKARRGSCLHLGWGLFPILPFPLPLPLPPLYFLHQQAEHNKANGTTTAGTKTPNPTPSPSSRPPPAPPSRTATLPLLVPSGVRVPFGVWFCGCAACCIASDRERECCFDFDFDLGVRARAKRGEREGETDLRKRVSKVGAALLFEEGLIY
jgi:hypothetical protein